MTKCIIDMLLEYQIEEDDELLLPEESVSEEEDVESTTSLSNFSSSSESLDEYRPEEKKPRKDEFIPIETKIKIVNLAKKHPTWSLKSLQRWGGSALTNKKLLKKWETDIQKNGSSKEIWKEINNWTYDRFVEAKDKKQPVTTRMIQQWASVGAMQHQAEGMNFVALHGWVEKFKMKYRISKRKVTRYIKSRNALVLSAILKEADTFQKRVAQLIPTFKPEFIINTDQTGCE
ncbi:uncharacterized protein LOC143369784 [Andrena cerasifolii]|uniref:uncharacterized protein LOC143369784 n=1 Tax=Andrena cerasifolii TaxID=2819439 RepID=UPI004037A48C